MFSNNNAAKFDFPEYEGEPLNIIFASTPRCGSTLLGELLYSSKLAGYPHEYFHPQHAADYKDRWEYETTEEYVALLKKWRSSPNGAFSIKLHHHQMNQLGLDGDAMKRLFPNAKYIWIRREDKDNQAISLVKAIQTSKWISRDNLSAKAVYDFEGIRSQHKRLIDEERQWEDYFNKNNIVPLTVWYHELSRDYIAALMKIFDYLEFEWSDEKIPDLPFKKLANLQTRLWRFKYNFTLWWKKIRVEDAISPLEG